MRGLGGSRASCFIAFLRRCARRLRARPRQSLRIGRASRTEARGISYIIFFPSRHALRRRPISRPEDCASALWAGLAADAAPIYLPRHFQQERVAPQLQLLQSARGIFDQQPRGVRASQRNPAPAQPRPGSAPGNRPWCRR